MALPTIIPPSVIMPTMIRPGPTPIFTPTAIMVAIRPTAILTTALLFSLSRRQRRSATQQNLHLKSQSQFLLVKTLLLLVVGGSATQL